jgi:hypothetical protein
MSANMVLTSNDLRHLADALDDLTKLYNAHAVTPGLYEHGVTFETDAKDTISFRVRLVDGQLVIDDRYGS